MPSQGQCCLCAGTLTLRQNRSHQSVHTPVGVHIIAAASISSLRRPHHRCGVKVVMDRLGSWVVGLLEFLDLSVLGLFSDLRPPSCVPPCVQTMETIMFWCCINQESSVSYFPSLTPTELQSVSANDLLDSNPLTASISRCNLFAGQRRDLPVLPPSVGILLVRCPQSPARCSPSGGTLGG